MVSGAYHTLQVTIATDVNASDNNRLYEWRHDNGLYLDENILAFFGRESLHSTQLM